MNSSMKLFYPNGNIQYIVYNIGTEKNGSIFSHTVVRYWDENGEEIKLEAKDFAVVANGNNQFTWAHKTLSHIKIQFALKVNI